MASVKLEHIYKVYPNGTKAVNDISLDIKDGEFIVFVGPSGCGKSTTLRMIAGLEDITAGELYINNMIVNDVEPKDRDIAMVFQNYALYPHMTVYENLAFGLKLRHVPNEVIQEKVLEAANILGIKDYLDRKPKAMSGGQRQRVALGRAILRDPKVMLLDEPLSNLDAKLRAQMRTEIAKLHQKLKTTFIYVTHDQVEAMTLGDRVVVMKQGRIKQVDSPKNLYDYPSNKFVAGFIGTPQMNFFDCTLLRKGEKVEVSLKENKEKLVVPYNQLIKVLPDYFDGAHPITMGIRCEHINLVDEAVENSVKVKVSHFEELGSNCLIYGNINLKNDSITSEGSGNITIQVKNVSGIKPGDIIYVQFDMSYAYFFDSKSEETIVPRIPVYNSFEASVRDNQLCFLGSEIRLPKALYRADAEGIELRIPTDGFRLRKAWIQGQGNQNRGYRKAEPCACFGKWQNFLCRLR
jgi:multiple sugar transport system ATP-binding protein